MMDTFRGIALRRKRRGTSDRKHELKSTVPVEEDGSVEKDRIKLTIVDSLSQIVTSEERIGANSICNQSPSLPFLLSSPYLYTSHPANVLLLPNEDDEE